MYKLNHRKLNDKISSFLARKSSHSNLSQVIADRLVANDAPKASKKHIVGYELTPMNRTKFCR